MSSLFHQPNPAALHSAGSERLKTLGKAADQQHGKRMKMMRGIKMDGSCGNGQDVTKMSDVDQQDWLVLSRTG